MSSADRGSVQPRASCPSPLGTVRPLSQSGREDYNLPTFAAPGLAATPLSAVSKTMTDGTAVAALDLVSFNRHTLLLARAGTVAQLCV